MSMDSEKRLLLWAFGLIAGLFSLLVVLAERETAVQRECLRLGYRDSTTTVGTFGPSYCISRRDQTDVVVPLDTLRKEN